LPEREPRRADEGDRGFLLHGTGISPWQDADMPAERQNVKMAQRLKESKARPEPRTTDNNSDRLLAVMIANLARCKEPLLITRLKESVERIEAARRRCP
jgi:hypothetical protein